MNQKSRNRGVRATCEGIEKLEAARIERGWSYDKLVSETKISRDTVDRIITREAVDKESIRKIARAIDLQPIDIVAAEEWNHSPKKTASQRASNTLNWHKICHEMLEFQKRAIRRQATEIVSEPFYVQLGLVQRKHQSRRSSDFSLPPEQGSGFFQLSEEEIIKTYEHDEFLEQVIKQKQSKAERIAIIGEPGAGKTTLLEAIAFSPKTPGFPIWISLGSLGEKSLEEYLCQKWLKDALKTSDVTQQQKALEELFKSGEVLLLLDGVDEMPASSPVQALAKIREELTGWVAEARVVLTCRLNVWDASVNALQGFDTYRTLEFSYGDGNKPDQVKQFICQWFSKADKPELGEPLRKKLDEDRQQRIRDLVKNPLRLSLLCQSWYFRQGDLPTTKAALYEQFTEAFYEWKKGTFSTALTQREHLNAALGLLAREAIDKEKSRFGIRRDFALKILGEDLFKVATEKLNWLVEVYKDAETGKPVYAFLHPTFQEYFAACAIDDWQFFLNHNNENPNPFLKHNGKDCVYRIFEPQWKQVILLWLGRPDEEVPKNQKEEFIKALVEFNDGCGDEDFYWYRACFLAADGIAEFRGCSLADAIVEQIVIWVCNQTWYGSNIIAETALEILPDTDQKRVINYLTHILDHNKDKDLVCLSAATALVKIDPSQPDAISTLTKLARYSSFEPIEWTAARVLLSIAPDNPEALDKLSVEFLEEEHENWLQTYCDENSDTIANLIKTLCFDKDNTIRLQAAESLREMDIDSSYIFLDYLIESLQGNQDKRISRYITCLLGGMGEIGFNNSEAIVYLIELLDSQDELTREWAAESLGKIGLESVDTINALKLLLNDSNKKIRYQSAVSLGRIAPNNSEILPILIEILRTPTNVTSIDEAQLQYAAATFIFNLLEDNHYQPIVIGLKDCFQEPEYKIRPHRSTHRNRYQFCYQIMWHSAQNMNYTDFYQAWNDHSSQLRESPQCDSKLD